MLLVFKKSVTSLGDAAQTCCTSLGPSVLLLFTPNTTHPKGLSRATKPSLIFVFPTRNFGLWVVDTYKDISRSSSASELLSNVINPDFIFFISDVWDTKGLHCLNRHIVLGAECQFLQQNIMLIFHTTNLGRSILVFLLVRLANSAMVFLIIET